jgi:GNAT superfamily N-acetyltransferase
LPTGTALRSFAEEPAAWGDDFPEDSEWQRVLTDRYCLLLGPVPSSTQVSRLRLDEDDVAATITEVRAEIAARGHRAAHWNIGSSATPSDLVDRLVAHGLRPEDHVTPLVLTAEPPAAPAEIEARRVRDFEEFQLARTITHDVFGTPEDRRSEWEAHAREGFEAERTDRGARVYIAYLDGRAVGAANCVVEQGLPAAIMVGGVVVPDARSRGVYRALVRARWDDAAAAGLTALSVQARHTSRPILERLGFEPVGAVEVLIDPATC